MNILSEISGLQAITLKKVNFLQIVSKEFVCFFPLFKEHISVAASL